MFFLRDCVQKVFKFVKIGLSILAGIVSEKLERAFLDEKIDPVVVDFQNGVGFNFNHTANDGNKCAHELQKPADKHECPQCISSALAPSNIITDTACFA